MKIVLVKEHYMDDVSDEKPELIELRKYVERIIPFTEEIITSGDVIFLSNSNYKKIERDIERGAIEDKIIQLFFPESFFLTESNVFRNEKSSFFTFSPFQDTQRFFSLLHDGSSIKKQLCIRYVNKGDFTNPLFMSIHKCFSFQQYSFVNQCNNICSVIDFLSKEYLIEKNKIVVRIPKTCKEYLRPMIKLFKVNMCNDETCVARLDIPGTHYYVKILYDHNNGFLPFANFVLVDIKNNLSKLDSIIFQDRLELIKEKKTYIMQLDRYKKLVDEVIRDQPRLLDQELHEVTNHYITIFSLLYMQINSSNKGVGSELKRRVKAFVVFVKYYVTEYDPFKNIESVAEEVKKLYGFDSDSREIITAFRKIYSLVSETMEKNIRNLPKIKDVYSIEELSASFGIPKEQFGYRHIGLTDNYPFK